MGVLEDAIREHLDLKRMHGASDEELTRQEDEALGPGRRELPESEEEPADVPHDEAAEQVGSETPVDPPPEDEDPDFGASAPEQTSLRDPDFD